MRRTLIAALTGVVLLASATAVEAQQAAPSQPVIVAIARSAEVVDRIEALGTTRANESVQITANVTDKIAAIRFDDGQSVAAGEVLAVLDKAEEEADLKQAEATLAERRLAFERAQRLERRQLTPTEELDQRRAALRQAEAVIESLRARIADRVIRAPFGGVVGMRDISVGALVEPGDLITTLDDLHVVKLDFTLPAVHLAGLRPGLAIIARARALGDREFRGEVKSIDSRVDPVTRSIVARAVLPNPDGAIKPGLLMSVQLLMNPRDAVVIPEAALIPLGQSQSVLVVNEAGGNRVERREVRIGTRRPGEVEIVEGLVPGEKVITHGLTQVQPGQSVVIRAVEDGSRSLHEMLETGARSGADS